MSNSLKTILEIYKLNGIKYTVLSFIKYILIFPGFLFHELSHIIMIFLTLSYNKVSSVEVEFFDKKENDKVTIYGLTINMNSDLNPISGMLIATAPIILLVVIWFISALNIDKHFIIFVSMMLFIILNIDIIMLSSMDIASFNYNYRKFIVYLLKRERRNARKNK